MKTNKILIFAALGIGALLLFSGKKDNESGEGAGGMFTLPDGTKVPESQLPSLGYIRHEGQWKHQSELTTPDMPANVDPNSPQWLSILNASLQSGSQLYSMSSELASALSRSIKSTAVNWDDKAVTVTVKFGFQVYNGVVTPFSNITKTYSDQQIVILGKGPQAKITLLKGGAVQKEAIIDFNTKKLIGFSAGSVISGTGVVGYRNSNIDTVTSIFGVGSIYRYNHPKGLTHCQDGTYSDSHKGACSYHGGAHEIKLRKGMRDYTGKGNYDHYMSYRKAYKNAWAKQNRKSDRVTTL